MFPASFDYHRPKTLAEAIQLLSRNPEARVLAGGHSLVPAMKLRLAQPEALVDIGRLHDLRGIRADGDSLRIGALTTHAEVAASKVVKEGCRLLAETAAQIGDLQVRNRGTLGGSLAHADPAADYPTAVVALDATLVVEGPGGRRELPAAGFFVELFATALQAGELITEVRVPAHGKGAGGAYVKHRHPASSYAVVGVAALVELKRGACTRVSLVVGGASANPVHAAAAEAALVGKAPDAGAVAAAAAKVADALPRPLGDHYASGEFRRHLATVLARRALTAAVERARA